MPRPNPRFAGTLAKSQSTNRLRRLWPAVVFGIIVVAVIGLQTDRVGFEADNAGWVTSMHLALIKNTGADNLFVGYVEKSIGSSGSYRYFYFNRAPVLFEAISHYLLAPFRYRPTLYTYLGHQLMNVVFLATMFLTYKLALLVLESRRRAGFVSLMVFSGFYFQHFKDLVEQNRLGVLAFAMLAYLIALEEKGRSPRFFHALVAVACLMGEAAPGAFMLLAWNLVHLLRESVRARGFPQPKSIVRSRPFKAGCVGLLTVCCALGYNVVAESITTDRPLMETSIVESAAYRLGHDSRFQNSYARRIAWPSYAKEQWLWFRYAGVPYTIVRSNILQPPTLNAIYGALAFVSFLFLYKRRRQVGLFGTYAIGVLLFAAIMRNLLAFHDFTATSYIGIHVLMFVALAWSLPRLTVTLALVLSLAVFLTSVWKVRVHLNDVGREVNPLAFEFDRIVQELPRDLRVHIHFDRGHRRFIAGAPYAPAFFVSPHVVARSPRVADFVVSKSPNLDLEKVATGTRRVFLYRNLPPRRGSAQPLD